MEAVNLFSSGLIQDTRPAENPQGSWVSAENITVSRGKTLSNERGTAVSGNFNSERYPIGKVFITNKRIVFSTDELDSISEIGILDKNGNYTRVLASSLFGFSKNFPIQATARLTTSGDILVSWTDFKNPMRVLNITNLPFTLDEFGELEDSSMINTTLVFQNFTPCNIEVLSVNDTGGSIRTGAVQFCIGYSNIDISRTDISNPTLPVYISRSRKSAGWQKYIGSEGNLTTSKSISLKFTNLDERFDFLHICVLQSINGSLSLYELPKININSSELEYTYTGSETVTDLLLEELLVDRTRYSTARTVTQVTDRLYFGNLKSDEKPVLQSYFNELVVNYTTKEVRSGKFNSGFDAKDPKIIYTSSSFFPGEVYALYGAVRFRDGSISEAYHIPGRAVAEIVPTVQENAVIQSNGTLLSDTFLSISYLGDFTKDFNSGASRYFHTRPTSDNPNASTNMGFWENLNEFYPNDVEIWGDLAGQNVRHHRFPESYQVNEGNVLKQISLKSIGIEVSNLTAFPEEILEQISSFEFFYARKDISNSLIIAQDITRFEVGKGDFSSEYNGSSGGNWDTEQYYDGAYLSTGRIDYQRLRSYTFDIIKDKPSISPTHITFQYGLISEELNKPYTFLDGFEVKREVSGNETDGSERRTNLFGVLDYSDSNGVSTNVNPISHDDYLQSVDSVNYVPANVDVGTDLNRWGSEHLLLNTSGAPEINKPMLQLRYSSNGQFRKIKFAESLALREEVYVYNICQIRRDVHNSFSNQNLVSMGTVHFGTEDVTIYGGDTNISQHSYTETTRVPVFDSIVAPSEEFYRLEDQNISGIKIARRFFGYFRSLPGYRHIDQGNINSLFYNFDETVDFLEDFRRDLPESYLYNPDYSLKNSSVNISPYNPFVNFETKFPNRIIRSVVQGLEQQELQWNRFLPGDYFEMQKNRGEIVNLQGENERLLIHCEDSLFVTRTNETLTGEESNITITSGDIFALPPKELIVSDTGYCGLASTFSAERFKIGYVFADQVQGKVFIVNDSVEEISSKGNRFFFLDNLKFTFGNGDYPYLDNGIIFGFDEQSNRILLTKKELIPNRFDGDDPEVLTVGEIYRIKGLFRKAVTLVDQTITVPLEPEDYTEKNFTLSYGEMPDGSWKWISFHDYIPDMYLSDRENMFTFKDNIHYVHNSLVRSMYGNTYRSSFDMVFNQPKNITKVFASMKWISECIDGKLSEQNKSFDRILLYNSYQCSGYVELPNNIVYVENEWRFNKFMDIVIDRDELFLVDKEVDITNLNPNMPYFKQRKFIDKFIVVRMVYNNVLSKDIYLYNIDVNIRQSSN